MTEYRLYLVKDGPTGRGKTFSSPDDATAIMWADDLREGRAAELWCGKRLVRTFEPKG
ncbi:MAG TPA: hypothetical protein VFW19_08650 [Allosphingosinicella sp.]|nr:hypothetical protein [Allosphingosinicella sp.]